VLSFSKKEPPLSAAALRHIRHLCEQIGPRAAGSPAEEEARAYAAVQLEKWGYRVERQAALFAPPARVNLLEPVISAVLLAGSALWQALPWLALLMPVLMAALPDIERLRTRWRRCTASSANLCAHPAQAAPAGSPLLIVCAHLDSPRNGMFESGVLRRYAAQTTFFTQRYAILLALLAVADQLVIPLPRVVLAATVLAGMLLVGWRMGLELLSLLRPPVTHSPGANDNASGVGVLLAVAEHFAKHPPRGTQLEFCLTGAEETGMHGAAARAALLARRAPQVLMLNLDMVGAGDKLRFITRDGVLLQRATSVRLNKAIRMAQSASNGIWYTLRSADYLPFLQRGIAASGLQTSGSVEAELAYHTQYDTVDVIDSGALDLTANAVVGVVRQLDLGR
jgi:hypothetical protein